MTDAHGKNSPSRWAKRLWLSALALVGCGIASYLALYQLGAVANVWEPLFGNGSRAILQSSASRLLPVPDATLGAFGYLLEAVCAVIGGQDRWRSMAWMVFVYAGIVGLFALVSAALIILQFAYFHAWCSLCMVSAVISFVIAGLAFDEPCASLLFLQNERKLGRSVWAAVRGEIKKGES